jgi:uracil-DNA glycosylase
MTTPEDKTRTRNAIITHLETLKQSGVDFILSDVSDMSDLSDKSETPTAPSSFDPSTPPSCHSLESLEKVLGDCDRCPLHKERQNIVFGVGSSEADLMFIGEGPGQDEDEQGIPFVGRAGQLLTKMIEAMGFTRDDVYIANVVKCRPPNNRNPLPDEMDACIPFLKQQLAIVKPKIIVCLGKVAAHVLLETQIPISKMRGTFKEFEGVRVMPTFHPAYLLRNPAMKRFVWDDLKKVMAELKA